MEENEETDLDKRVKAYGMRAQRCFGCLIAFHLKDMYLGEDVSYYCENCKDDTMFHFNDFSKLLDKSKLREL